MAKSLTQMAADIVAAQASHVSMSADEMDAAIKKVFEALKEIKVIEETPAGEAVDDELARLRANPMKSIQRTYVINCKDSCQVRADSQGISQEMGFFSQAGPFRQVTFSKEKESSESTWSRG